MYHPIFEASWGGDAILKQLRQSILSYEGTNPDPDPCPTWCCKTCHKRKDPSQERRLKACARRMLAYYCNASCQRRDFPEHKAECKRISQLQKAVDARTPQLSAYTGPLTSEGYIDEPCNIFEEYCGGLWYISETRDYCRARCLLAHVIERMAYSYKVAPLLEKVVAHRLVLLRLMGRVHFGLRDLVLFTMLRLNQDERCASFIMHWIRRLCTYDSDEESSLRIYELNELSADGDWLYGSADDYADMFETVPDFDPDSVFIALLIAFCIINLRIIAKYDADHRQIETIQATSAARQLDDDSAQTIEKSVVGDERKAERVVEQEKLVNMYFDIIQIDNPTLLPAIINPGLPAYEL